MCSCLNTPSRVGMFIFRLESEPGCKVGRSRILAAEAETAYYQRKKMDDVK